MVPQPKRIKFSKTGKLIYISHLDLCRTMRKAFTRAEVPIWYSEGFNPHPKMVFALTVSTGSSSLCEYLDIKIVEEMSDGEIKDRLNGALGRGIDILEVYSPETKFTSLEYSEYKIEFFDGTKIEDIKAAFGKEMTVTRKTKGGEVTSDISPMIKSANFFENEGRAVIDCILTAGQNSYLNPEYVAKAVGGNDYDITRTQVYFADAATPFR